MTDLSKTLEERGSRYGRFDGHSEITQALKRTLRGEDNQFSERASAFALAWVCLSDDQRESLEMIVHKIGRILNGDPNYADSWADIAGYAKLVADRLEEDEREKLAKDLVSSELPARDLGNRELVRAEATTGTHNVEIHTKNSSAVRGGQRAGAGTRKGTGR